MVMLVEELQPDKVFVTVQVTVVTRLTSLAFFGATDTTNAVPVEETIVPPTLTVHTPVPNAGVPAVTLKFVN